MAVTERSPALKLTDVSCSFGAVRAVRNVTLEVEKGSFVGIVGPNGAGKSTLIDCISGRNRQYTGKISLFERDTSQWPLHRVASLGVIRTFQVPRLFPRLTVLSNVMSGARQQLGERFVSSLIGTWRRQESELLPKAVSSLNHFTLGPVAQNYGSELSGGQERLVELSRAAMAMPRLLLLDEPFAGVSPSNRAQLARHLRYLWQEHEVTVVMVEHRLEWVERLCPRVVVMAEGSVLTEGDMGRIRSDSRVLEAYLGTP